ncbi:MAG: spore germination protein [Oscillospiraceae bacterium]|nr:spore germination protein [Oscillospiraceae bacterium]
MLLSGDFERAAAQLDALLGVGRCFDVVARELYAGRRRCRVYGIDGYGDSAVLERVLGRLISAPSTVEAQSMREFIERYVSFAQAEAETDLEKAVTGVLQGKTLLLAEGFAACALIDAKQVPSRSVDEPSSGKVLRGAHDGFIESLTVNAALLRRRIRDPRLTLEGHQISEGSRADVALCYLEHKVDRKLLEDVRGKLGAIDLRSVSMSQETIAEAMMARQWWNPLPKVRYTERPDVATACLMEGSIIVLVDNSPAAMILPTCFFDFVKEANDFYFPPLVGSYLRILRYVVFVLTLFITPVWYALVKTSMTQGALHFLAITEDYEVPLLVQLLFAEFIVDLIKLTSLNTPSIFSNSFSMIGALVLGDFAVQAHWMVPEVLAYMAFVAIANFAQPSYELGYAFKLLRLMLLLLVGALDWAGLAIGCAVIAALLASTRPIGGKSYLYPLIPFDRGALRSLLLRRPVSRENT